MQIRPYTPAMLPHIVQAYNAAVAPVPHCYRVRRDDLRLALAPVVDGEQSETRRDEAVFVAVDQKTVAGFVHVAIGPPKPHKDPEEEGLIRFLWYRPGLRQAGEALLDAAEKHVRERGHAAISAFPQKHRYPFYHLAAAYLSDYLGHVIALLGLGGYRRSNGEVFLDWQDFSLNEPGDLPVSAQIQVEHTDGRGRLPGVTVRAMQGDRQIGICENASAGEFSRDRLAQEWLFTTWLAVDGEYEGMGLGRWLLHRALWEGRVMGYRHAAISTAWENYRALMFYSNFGYQVVDWTYGYRRELDQD
jgi:ribosomal protein S18 acetylase RimI-like enzyme